MRRTLLLGSVLLSAMSWAQVTTSEAPYVALSKGVAYIHPSAARLVKMDQVNAAAERLKPLNLKVMVVPSLGNKWVRNGQEQRGSYAKYAFEDKLSLRNGILIVVTQRGITGYSDKVAVKTLASLNNAARSRFDKNDFTPMIVGLADDIAAEANRSAVADGVKTNAGSNVVPIVIAVGALGTVGFLGIRAANQKRKLDAARKALDTQKAKAIEEISYLDSYVDLIADEDNRKAIQTYRDRAYGMLEDANQRSGQAKKVEELLAVETLYKNSVQEASLGRPHIEAATNGTKVAYTIPPKYDPSAPPAPIYAPYEGVCFFTGKPDPNLTPVTINLDGQKRTVMASQEALREMQQYGEPQMRGTYDQGRFVPWYMVRTYDPYSMYGGANFVWQTMAMSSMINLFNPFWSPALLMGGYFSPFHHTYFDPTWSAAGWSPDAGGAWGMDAAPGTDMFDLNQSGDFGGSVDFGGGDFGGGSDFGGGDFGGGDFGGGGDF